MNRLTHFGMSFKGKLAFSSSSSLDVLLEKRNLFVWLREQTCPLLICLLLL